GVGGDPLRKYRLPLWRTSHQSWARTSLAVRVPPERSPATRTSSPLARSLRAASLWFLRTRVSPFAVHVQAVPSELLTVSAVPDTSVISPRWKVTTRKPPSLVRTVVSPWTPWPSRAPGRAPCSPGRSRGPGRPQPNGRPSPRSPQSPRSPRSPRSVGFADGVGDGEGSAAKAGTAT